MPLAAELVDLGDRLTRAGFVVTTQQHLAAGRLLTLIGGLEPPLDRDRLALHLAPIYCTNAAEQERFGGVFADFCDARADGPVVVVRPPLAQRLRRVQKEVRKRLPRWTVAMAFVAVLASIAGPLGAWFAWQHLRPRTLSGSVTANGEPVGGATVSLGALSTETDALGTFSLDVPARELPAELVVRHAEHGERSQTVGDELAARRRRLYLGETRDIALPPLAPIELGRVVETPIEDVVIEAPPQEALDPVALLWTINVEDPDMVPPAPLWRRLRPGRTALAAAPLLVAGALLLWRQRRKAVARRERSREPRGARRLKLTGEGWRLGRDLHLGRLARDLRRRRLEVSQELQVAATIRSTLRRGGMFTPEFGSRVEAEYLVLVDSRGLSDHQARLSREIVVQLEAAGVILEVFTFDGDAGLCQRVTPKALRRELAKTDRPARPLAEGAAVRIELLRSRLPHRRVLIIGDGAGLFDPFTGEPRPWLRTVLEWPDPVLISTRPPPLWGEAEAAAARLGLVVVACEGEDLERLARVYDEGRDTERQRSIAEATGRGRYRQIYRGERFSYERRTGRWLDSDPPPAAARDQLVRELRDPADLGADGFLWAAACAAYPELHWDLTLRLGERLLAPEERSRLLPRLTRLVWFRESFMPDWLRDTLLGALSRADEERARGCVREILRRAIGGSDSDQGLELALDPQANALQRLRAVLARGWRRWRERRRLDEAVRSAETDSPLRDHVFLRFLSRGRMGRLTQAMPSELLRVVFPGAHPILGTRPIWALGAAAALSLMVGILLGALDSTPPRVASMAFSRDGSLVATALDSGGVMVWDVESKSRIGTSFGPRARVSAVAFGPDGSLVAAAGNEARVWETRTGAAVTPPLEHPAAVSSVAFSPDGATVLTSADDGYARLWDPRTGASLRQFRAADASFDATGKRVLLRGEEGRELVIAESATGRTESRLDQGTGGEFTVVALDPQGRARAVTGRLDGIAQLWDLSTSREIATVADASAEGESIADVSFSPDGSSVVAVAGSVANVSDAETGGTRTTVRQTSMGRARFSADGRWLVTSDLLDGNAQIWDSSTGAPIGQLLEYVSSKPFLTSSQGPSRLLTSDGVLTRTWTLPTGRSRSFALLVANNYPGTTSPLRGAQQAQELASVLRRDFGFGVTLLTEASKAQVSKAFEKLKAILQPEDRLLVYFSGNGYAGELSGNQASRRYAFVASSNPDDPVALVGSDELAEAWSIPVREFLFVVDTSYGDQLLEDWTYSTPSTQFGARDVLISSREPMAWEGPSGSVFAESLVAELRSTRGGVTSSELFAAIERRMSRSAAQSSPARNMAANRLAQSSLPRSLAYQSSNQLPGFQSWGEGKSFVLPQRITDPVRDPDAGTSGDTGDTGGVQQTNDTPEQRQIEPVLTVEGPTTGFIDQELAFTASATGCSADDNGWSWRTASFETSSNANGTLTYAWSKPGTQSVEASNRACGDAVGRATVTIEERVVSDEQTAQENRAREAALRELQGRPIRFFAASEDNDGTGIQGRFVGEATLKGETILISVDETAITFSERVPSEVKVRLVSVEARLDCRSSSGSLAMRGASGTQTVEDLKFDGELVRLGRLDFQVPIGADTDLERCWVAFDFGVRTTSPNLAPRNSIANGPRGMFAPPRATAN